MYSFYIVSLRSVNVNWSLDWLWTSHKWSYKEIFIISKIATNIKSLFILDLNWGVYTNKSTIELIIQVAYNMRSTLPSPRHPVYQYRVGQKQHTKLMTIIRSNVTDFQKSFTEKFFSNFFSKVIIKDHITPHRPTHRYTTLWNINVRKQAINDKWQGSVATYLRCGEIVNNHFNKGVLLSLSVIFFNRWIFGKVKQERGCLVHFVRGWPPYC